MSTNENDILARIKARRSAGFGSGPSPEDEALARLNKRGGSATGDFVRTALRTPSLGFLDEMRGGLAALLPGGDSYAEARDRERQIQKDIDLLSPGAATASKIAGGVAAVPLGALGAPAKAVGAARGIAIGAGAGAALAGAQHVGEGEGSFVERSQGALAPMAVGGALGGAASTALEGGARLVNLLRAPAAARAAAKEGAETLAGLSDDISRSGAELEGVFSRRNQGVVERYRQRQAALADQAGAMTEGVSASTTQRLAEQQRSAGERVASKVRGAVGINEPVDAMLDAAEGGKKLVGELRYRPIEERGPVVSERIRAFLDAPEIARDVRAVGIEAGTEPTFPQLQALRNRFRSGANQDRDLFRQIDNLMGEEIEGLAAGADAPYAGFSEAQRQVGKGVKAGSWTSAQLRRHVRGLGDSPAANDFRQAYVENNVVNRLLRKEDGSPYLKSLLDGGLEMDDRLKAVVSDEQFAAIKQAIAEERQAIASLEREQQVGSARVARQAEREAQSLTGMEADELSELGARDQGTRDWLGGLQGRTKSAQAQGAELERRARNLANRIRQIIGGSALLGAGWKGRQAYLTGRAAADSEAP